MRPPISYYLQKGTKNIYRVWPLTGGSEYYQAQSIKTNRAYPLNPIHLKGIYTKLPWYYQLWYHLMRL